MSVRNSSPFSSQASLYARYRPSYPVALYEYVISHLDRKRYAWDCGTGSGQVAAELAAYFEKVYATDISREQLSHAVARENVSYISVPAEDSGLPAGRMDLITVGQAVHWFDFRRFYEEVRRTAARGSLLALFGYGIVQVNEQVDPVVQQLYEHAFGTYFSEARSYVEQSYRTVPFPFDEIPSPSFGINLRWTPDELEGYFNSWSAIQKFKSEKGGNPAEDAMNRIREIVSPEEMLEVTFPVFLRLGRVHPSDAPAPIS